jgi:hypothetical protein
MREVREIYVVNPGGKPPKTKKKGKTMAKGKGKKKGGGGKKKKRSKNPSAKSAAKRASRAISKSVLGLNFKKVFAELPYTQAGMFSAAWAKKRLGGTATETDPESWDWSSYLKASLGPVALAMLINSFKRGKGQLVLAGGLNYVVFKAIQNELVAGSDWASGQFGAEEDWTVLGQDDDDYIPTEYLMTGTDENPYAYDESGNMYPADDRHRLPEVSGVLEPVTSLGDVLEPVGPLGEDPWARAFLS